LPLLYLFSELSQEERENLTTHNDLDDPSAHAKIRSLVLEKGAVGRAMQKARDYAERSVEELASLPDTPFKDSLRYLADYCLERVR